MGRKKKKKKKTSLLTIIISKRGEFKANTRNFTSRFTNKIENPSLHHAKNNKKKQKRE